MTDYKFSKYVSDKFMNGTSVNLSPFYHEKPSFNNPKNRATDRLLNSFKEYA